MLGQESSCALLEYLFCTSIHKSCWSRGYYVVDMEFRRILYLQIRSGKPL